MRAAGRQQTNDPPDEKKLVSLQTQCDLASFATLRKTGKDHTCAECRKDDGPKRRSAIKGESSDAEHHDGYGSSETAKGRSDRRGHLNSFSLVREFGAGVRREGPFPRVENAPGHSARVFLWTGKHSRKVRRSSPTGGNAAKTVAAWLLRVGDACSGGLALARSPRATKIPLTPCTRRRG